jgi:hypothetical protein
MMRAANYLNNKWNRAISWFHDVSVRTNIRWLVKLSVWAFDRLMWRLPEEWQMINGMPLKEFMLRHELEIAHHQIRYYCDYAHHLQFQILFSEEENARFRKKAKQHAAEAK